MKKPNWKLWLKDKNECKEWLDNYIKKNILVKSKDESNVYLKKSTHNLDLAKWLNSKHKDEITENFGDDTFYDWVIIIGYYAIYHSALALVSKEGYKSKNHSATLCFLIFHHYHSQKALEEEDIKLVVASLDKKDIETIGASKEVREKASYDIHELFEKDLADNMLDQAVEFASKIGSILKV